MSYLPQLLMGGASGKGMMSYYDVMDVQCHVMFCYDAM